MNESALASMISEEMEKSLFTSPGPPPPLTQSAGPPPTSPAGSLPTSPDGSPPMQLASLPPSLPASPSQSQPSGSHPAHTIRICSSLGDSLVQGFSPVDHLGRPFLEVCSSEQYQPKNNLEFCSILYGPENLNIERCSSLLPGNNNLCLPSNCSVSPIRRGSSIGELEGPMDLEDSVFVSPGKSVRDIAPSATYQPEVHKAPLPLSRLLCLSSCVLALPLLTLGVTMALDLPSMATSSLTAAIFLSALVLVAALLSVFAR